MYFTFIKAEIKDNFLFKKLHHLGAETAGHKWANNDGTILFLSGLLTDKAL